MTLNHLFWSVTQNSLNVPQNSYRAIGGHDRPPVHSEGPIHIMMGNPLIYRTKLM